MNAGSPPWTGADGALIAGIAAYRRHPWQRELADPPVRWQEGNSRLLDYGGDGPLALFVPSLVNRAYVLDISPERSMLRWLAERGVRPLLMDWGWPDAAERKLDLTELVAGRLERALGAAGERVILVGYCMGGLLALAAAQRQPELIRGLGLLATPWDFHVGAAVEARRIASMLPKFEPLLAATGALSVDALQALFATVEPDAVAERYRAFGRMAQDSEAACNFVALEDWLNDGVPLAAPIAREALASWYGANSPARGAWQIAGDVVSPSDLRIPAFVAVPGRDRIVPPESAEPLAALIQGAILHRPPLGHVGMVIGSRAKAALWAPLLDWMRRL